MADTKISALTAVSGAARSMLIPVVEDPSGTPVTKKMTVSQLLSLDSGSHSSSSPLLDMAQTWNAGGTTFTALKFNIAATAAAADSLLLDIQVGGTSKFKVRHDGLATATGLRVDAGSISAPGVAIGADNTGIYNSGGLLSFTQGGSLRAYFGSSLDFVLYDATTIVLNNNLYLRSEAANTFALRNATAAQTLRIYNTYTDASNYERAFLRFSGNSLEIGAEGAGTGSTSRSMFFYVGGSQRWQIQGSTGHLFAVTDNTYDIGASGATRPRDGFWGRYIYGSEARFPALTLLASNAGAVRGYITANATGVFMFQNAAASDFDRLQLGGTTSSFPAIKRVSAGLKFVVADDSASAAVEALSYTSGTPSGGTAAAWKFGVKVTSGTSSLNTGEYVELDIGGTLVKLATVTNV